LVFRGNVVRGNVVRGNVVRGNIVRGNVVRGNVVRGTDIVPIFCQLFEKKLTKVIKRTKLAYSVYPLHKFYTRVRNFLPGSQHA
jgi:hypothetical protein